MSLSLSPISRQSRHTVMAWFLWCFTAAVLLAATSPWLRGSTLELICVGTGGSSLVVTDADGKAGPVHGDSLNCALCLSAGAPPSLVPPLVFAPVRLSAQWRSIALPQVRITQHLPPPARAPPAREV